MGNHGTLDANLHRLVGIFYWPITSLHNCTHWCIINFEHADNIFGGIGEHNKKPSVKDPARRTRCQNDQEYNTLFK